MFKKIRENEPRMKRAEAPADNCAAHLIDHYPNEEDGQSLKMESLSFKRQNNAMLQAVVLKKQKQYQVTA